MPIVESNSFLDKIKLYQVNGYIAKYINHIISLIGVLVLVNGVLYFVLPKYESIIQAREKERVDLENQITYLENYSDVLSAYNKQYESISPDEKKIVNNIVLDGDNLEDLYRYFEKIGKDRNLILNKLDISLEGGSLPVAPASLKNEKGDALLSKLGAVRISLGLDGINYDNLKEFLRRIQNDSLLMDINNLSFSLSAKTADISLTCYYLKDTTKP